MIAPRRSKWLSPSYPRRSTPLPVLRRGDSRACTAWSGTPCRQPPTRFPVGSLPTRLEGYTWAESSLTCNCRRQDLGNASTVSASSTASPITRQLSAVADGGVMSVAPSIMGHVHRFVQANLNHPAMAYDLFFHTIAE